MVEHTDYIVLIKIEKKKIFGNNFWNIDYIGMDG